MILKFKTSFKNCLLLHGLPDGIWYDLNLLPDKNPTDSSIFNSMIITGSNPSIELIKIYLNKEELLNEL